MNGVHDMGGMHGFGEVQPEENEPVFHAPWEGRALAMNRAMGALGLWNIDIGRFSREQLPADVYLGSSYYRKWILGLEDLAVQTTQARPQVVPVSRSGAGRLQAGRDRADRGVAILHQRAHLLEGERVRLHQVVENLVHAPLAVGRRPGGLSRGHRDEEGVHGGERVGHAPRSLR